MALSGSLRGKRVAVLGLAFKPDSDDVRDAVSVRLINRLLEIGANVVAYDPAAMKNARTVLGERVEYCDSALECIRLADCCFLVTEWNEFSNLEPKDFFESMKKPILIDGRRIYNESKFREAGVRFAAIGLGPPEVGQDPGGFPMSEHLVGVVPTAAHVTPKSPSADIA